MALSYIGSLLLGATLAAATLCGDKQLPKGQSTGSVFNISITSDDLDRNFLISIPPEYHPHVPTPVILSYHGGERTAESQLQLDQLTNPEFNTKTLVVYPQGVDNTWQGVPGITTNDIQFTRDILNEITSKYCIDTTRIWTTGKSDGAGFCNLLACDSEMSARFAAFAPVSGAYYIDTLPCLPATVDIPCQTSRTDIPLLAFHGGNDTTISYWGGERKNECLPTIPHFIQEWAGRDHLSVRRNKTLSVASDTVVYSFGARGLVGLVYDSVIGHDWPSTVPNSDNEVAGHHVASFNATPMILEFFDRHSLF
ncbi:carbohydrate esterase family 1 protein [Penicillium verhagenii]|uniref:carbohydrate esterase family 1 protein n=1 Tax=Penicillium verhagenii TaxID=1562060 RepID=UPI002544FB80|nr:carbohydrate esterase family 1 protein [Penicillium verhagenii]KAJ5947571.1 carbohydrate esterase family 1 protein [Penicillium verhagenii]